MLSTKVKANSITNLTDARYFAAWEVEWLSFNFDSGSESFIHPTNMLAIKEWVDGVKITGSFQLHSAAEIQEAIEKLELSIIEAGMLTSLEQLAGIPPETTVIKEIVVQAEDNPYTIMSQIDPFLPIASLIQLNFSKNNINWDQLPNSKPEMVTFLKSLCQKHEVLLDFNFSAKNLPLILEEIQPAGICLQGGAEEKVGFKSFDELDELFEILEINV